MCWCNPAVHLQLPIYAILTQTSNCDPAMALIQQCPAMSSHVTAIQLCFCDPTVLLQSFHVIATQMCCCHPAVPLQYHSTLLRCSMAQGGIPDVLGVPLDDRGLWQWNSHHCHPAPCHPAGEEKKQCGDSDTARWGRQRMLINFCLSTAHSCQQLIAKWAAS